jgi:hypothetical protein
VSRDAILGASTPAELRALGARQLNAADIQSELVGQTLTQGSWIWSINRNGTASSKANNNTWTSSSTWDIVGNQYCRQSTDSPRKCSDVYELSGVYRFSESTSELVGWAVTVQ